MGFHDDVVNASGQPDDLRPILLNKPLGVRETIPETLDLLDGTPSGTCSGDIKSRQFQLV
jgi:hypothetical protein